MQVISSSNHGTHKVSHNKHEKSAYLNIYQSQDQAIK